VSNRISRRTAVASLFALSVATCAMIAGASMISGAYAADPIKIGELNSYGRFAAFTQPYRNGWQLAVEEVNAAGGVNGRMLEVISRDDGAKPGDAVRVAEELVSREKVDLLFGTFLSNIGLAVSDFAAQNKALFLAAEPLSDAITMAKGNRYTFRMRPNTYMQTKMLVDQAKSLGVKRWAIVAPNYAYGQSAAENFKRLIKEAIPDAEIVAEQYPALGKIDAGATVSAMAQAKPDGVFNVLFGGDLAKFVREGNVRGLFENRTVLSLLTGEPEWLDILKDEAPKGWIVTGYPVNQIKGEGHQTFVDAYKAKFNDTPRLGSLLGYSIIHAIKAAVEKAGSTDTEKLVDAFEGLEYGSPIGNITMRGEDHQATMGAWLGKLDVKDGKGVMTDWSFADGKGYMFSLDEVMKVRPK
jgi:branched-chain amino acid transport system substrate-binding protein